MSTYQWLLSLHLLGAFLFVSGGVFAGILHAFAMRLERPSQIGALLRLARWAVPLVGVGSLLVLAMGIWLAEHTSYGIGDTWVIASIVLWVAAGALGAVGGRPLRRARELAVELARQGDQPSEALGALVRDRTAMAANYLSVGALVAILVLMVWKPGA